MQPHLPPSLTAAPAPWALLDRASAQDSELAVRYACLSQLLAQDRAPEDRAALALELSAHWKVPSDCRDLARLLLSLPALAGEHTAPDADQVMQLLLASDALRRPERFRQWLQARVLVDDSAEAAVVAADLSHWLDIALQVDTAAAASLAAARGLGGVDLGAAVLAARREAIVQAMSQRGAGQINSSARGAA